MAAFAQQQRPQQQQQQQFSHGRYPSTPPVANDIQGQYNQGQAVRSVWQAPATQTSNQAWEQSQLYDYQPVQAQTPGLLHRQTQEPQQPPAQQYQHAQPQQQQQQQQQPDADLPHRQPSFVGLPPIRRTSTLLGSVVNIGEDDDDATSIASSQLAGQGQTKNSSQLTSRPQFAGQMQTQEQFHGTPQQYQITGGYRPSQLGTLPHGQSMLRQGAHGSPQPLQNFHQSSPGLHGRAFSGPVHPQGIAAIPNRDPRFSPQPHGQGQDTSSQDIPPVLRQNAGAVSPNAEGHLRLPPQGAWKLEESHLQQPLLSPSRNRSPSNATTPTSQNQPFYGFDKETGLSAQVPSPSQRAQASQGGQQGPLDAQGEPQPGQVERSDTLDTTDSDLPPPGRARNTEDRQAKRNSGLFSNIRGRFSREGPEDRRDSVAGSSVHPMSDAVSESSIATEELQERRKRHSFFGGHGSSLLSQPAQQPTPNGALGSSPLANSGANNAEVFENQPTSSAFEHRRQQVLQPQQLPLLEKKKTFLGLPVGPAEQPQPARPNMSRASTSSNTISQADEGHGNGGPMKRFSGLASKMFNRPGNNQIGQKTTGSSHSARPSFSQGALGGLQAGPHSFSGGFKGGFSGQQGLLARPPSAPAPTFAQLQLQPGAGQVYPQQEQRQREPPSGYQQVSAQDNQSPQQQSQQFPQGQQDASGQPPGQARPVGQQSPIPGFPENTNPDGNGQRTPLGQQSLFIGREQQGDQPKVQQQPAQQQPGQQPPRQQLPSPQPSQQEFQQRPPVQQPLTQQSLSQQQQQFQQQQPLQQQPGPQHPGLTDPPELGGRGRADSMNSRPFTAGSARPNPMMQHSSSSIGEEQRGRKPSGASFFSSIFNGRAGSKSRDSNRGSNPGQLQGPPGGPQLPGQQQYPGHFPGPQVHQYAPEQQRLASTLGQRQQQVSRPIDLPGQLGPPQPGQQPPGQPQFAHHRQVSVQQRHLGSGQQPPHNTALHGGPYPQQSHPGGVPRAPMMYPQLQSQLSQASIASASALAGKQQPGMTNSQRAPSMGQIQPNQQDPAREAVLRTAPGPLNQHPPLEASPPPQATLREDTVSPPIDDAASKAGPRASPSLTSPISQMSTTVPITPVERQSNDSPLSFRQPVAQQQQTVLNEAPRQTLQTSSPGHATQFLARKPVQSSPRPPQRSQASSVHGGSDHSQGPPSVSSVHTANITASPVDHLRRPSQQFVQLGTQQTGSPLAQQPQFAAQQQSFQTVTAPGQFPHPQAGSGPGTGIPGQDHRHLVHPGQSQGGPPGQAPIEQQAMRLVGQQQQKQQGQGGTLAPGQQGQPYPGPRPPWNASRTSSGISGPGLQQGQQQVPGPYFQVHPQKNGQDKEAKGTISKLINKAKEVTHTGSSEDKPEKDKSGRSRFGFLRSSKLPDQRQQPLQGGPQFQGPPGRPVMPQESQIERLQQLQSQISPSEAHPRPGTTPSPGPHLNYQHQRQSPPNGNSPQVQPAAGSTPSPNHQQALAPAQSAPSRNLQLQQGSAPTTQQGVPPFEPERFTSASRPGPPGQAGFRGFVQTSKPAGQQPGSAAQGLNEPQYGEVPIPTGYGKVHSEGRLEPAPVAYYMGPHGQFLPVQTGTPGSHSNVQPWVQPGTTQRQPSYGSPEEQRPGHGGQLQPQSSQQPVNRVTVASPGTSTPGATPGFPAGGTHPQPADREHPLHVLNPDQPDRSVVPTPQGETPQTTRIPSASFAAAPGTQSKGYAVPAAHAPPSRPEPERFSTAVSNPSDPSSPPPQLQHAGSPQSHPLPESTFSPVDPAAEHAPNPPLPPLAGSDLVPSSFRPLGSQLQMAVPQRQISAVSQVSSLQPGSTPRQGPPGSQSVDDSGGYLQARSPSPQATPDRNVSPEPATRSPPQQLLHVNVQQANNHGEDEDNIYDATPRTDTISMQQPAAKILSPPAEEPFEPKTSGTMHDLVEHKGANEVVPPQKLTINAHDSPSPSPSPPPAQPAPRHKTITSESTTNTTNGTSHSKRATPPLQASSNPADVFEEAKRKAVLRDMEEKIPVFPTEPDVDAQQLADMAAKKRAEDERPQMSATSYPGQEWNPYGDGWEDDD